MTLPQIQGFDLIEPLSEGRAYTSYKARQTALDRFVVMTVFHEAFAADGERFNAVIKEAKRAARLKYPGILQVFDFGEEQGRRYLVTEYVEGVSVEQILRSNNPWPQSKALEIVRAVSGALEFAWTRASIFHGALHPGRLWIDQGTVKIAGLGLTGLLAEERDESSIAYLPPDRLAREKPGMRDDLFALGLIVHDLLIGQLPQRGQFRDGSIVTVAAPEGVSSATWEIVRSLTAIDTSRRYNKWGEVLRDIDRALRDKKPESESSAKVRPADNPLPKSFASREGTLPPKVVGKARPLRVMQTLPPPERATGASGASVPAGESTPIRNAFPLTTALAWGIVVVIWGCLVWSLIHRPPFMPPIPVRELPPPVVVKALAVAPVQESSTPSPAAVSTPVNSPATAGNYIQEVRRRLVDLEDDVTRYLVREEYAMALGAIDVVLDDSQDAQLTQAVRSLRNFVGQVATLNDEVASALRLKSGDDVTLSFKGRVIKGRLLAVSGGQVDIEEIHDRGEAVVRIKQSLALSDLDALDRAQWLGGAKTPVHSAMLFILAERRNESAEKTRPLAAASGPLAPAFMRWMDKSAAKEAPAPSEGAEGT